MSISIKQTEVAAAPSNFTSPTDRRKRKTFENIYRELKDAGGTLDSQMKKCSELFEKFKNPRESFENFKNHLLHDRRMMSKECEESAYQNFYAKETCKLLFTKEICNVFINSEEGFYKTLGGRILHGIQKVFKSIFGSKTGQDKIKEAKALVNQIEGYESFKTLNTDVNNKRYESFGYKNNIVDKETLCDALETFQKEQNFEIRDFKNIINELEFPKANTTNLIQSKIIKLNNIFIKNGQLPFSRSLLLMRDHNNHWYAIFKGKSVKPLGKGAAKSVFNGWDLSFNRPVAIGLNIIAEDSDNNLRSVRGIKREYRIFDENQLGKYKSIMKIDTLFIEKNIFEKTCFLIGEIFNGSLSSKIKIKDEKLGIVSYITDKIPLDVQMTWGSGMINGLCEVHKEDLIHRDIKPANILVNDDRAVVADLDLVVRVDDIEGINKNAGTPLYVPPEAIRKIFGMMGDKKITQKFDIWSMGLTLYELHYGKFFFEEESARADTIVANLKEKAHLEWKKHLKENGMKPAEIEEYLKNLQIGTSEAEEYMKIIGNYTQEDIDKKFEIAKPNENADLIEIEIHEFLKSLIQVDQEKRPDIETVQKAYEAIREKLPNRNISTSNVGSRLPKDPSSEEPILIT